MEEQKDTAEEMQAADSEQKKSFSDLLSELKAMGWKKALRAYSRHLAIILILFVAAIGAGAGWDVLPAIRTNSNPAARDDIPSSAVTSTATNSTSIGIEQLPAFNTSLAAAGGLVRIPNLQTVFPTRERMEIVNYVVQAGDSLYGIAEKYGLRPHTILWGNYSELGGDVHSLKPGQELNVLPVDGVLHTYNEGESLKGIADAYNVDVKAIIDWPGNNLDPAINVDIPELPGGMVLVVPAGTGEVVDMTGGQITRTNPASASILGPGACPAVYDGAVGTNTFIFPTVERWVSGFEYDPVLHPALDFAGSEGNALYASDSGVIVYAGWNNYGYGNVIVIDHGNGWQTLYAHMAYIPSSIYCGLSVYQGAVIGPLGNTGNSTGPHLHFEMRSATYGKVNPWLYLQ